MIKNINFLEDIFFVKQYLKKYFFKEILNIERLSSGCNSISFEINNKYIVKFAIDIKTQDKLIKEAKLSSFLKSRLDLNIVLSNFFDGQFPFTIQRKIDGINFSNEIFNSLDEVETENLIYDLALFFYQMHSISLYELKEFDLPSWDRFERIFPSKEIIIQTLKKDMWLSDEQKEHLFNFCENYFKFKNENIFVFGHFDVLCKNLMFNVNNRKIAGIYDFGDAGIGNVEYDFANIDFGNLLFLEKLIVKYLELYGGNIKLSIDRIRDHSLFTRLAFYINFLNGIEKIQKTTFEKLINELEKRRL